MTNTSVRPFFVHYLDLKSKRIINNELAKSKVILPTTYSDQVYKYLSTRLKSIYERTFQYPESFFKLWTMPMTPGYIIYAKDGESFKIYHGKGYKNRLTVDTIESQLRFGKKIIYYGDQEFKGYECYVTISRRNVENNEYIKNLPLYSEANSELTTVNPFADASYVYKVGSISLMTRMPKYLQALDSKLDGKNMYNSDGMLNINEFKIANKSWSITGAFADMRITSINQASMNDIMILIPEIYLSESEVKLQNELLKEYERKGFSKRIEGNFTIVDVRTSTKYYRLTTILQLDKPIIPRTDEEKKRIMELLLISSYSSNVRIAINFNELKTITPLSKVNTVIRDALIGTAMQLRKTFLNDNDMGIAVVAPKGGLKSTVMKIIEEVYPEYVQIDSDTYGRWVSVKMQNKDIDIKKINAINSNCEIESVFEVMAREICLSCENKQQSKYDSNIANEFGRSYTTILSNSEYGIAKFQNEIYKSYGTVKVIWYLHTTIEANLISGAWQQLIIMPIHDTLRAVMSREREFQEENVLLHEWYKMMTPYSNRTIITWIDYMILLGPRIIQYLSSHVKV